MLNIIKLVISIFLLKLTFGALVATPFATISLAKAPLANTSLAQAHELTDTLVVNKTDNSVSLIDLESQKVIETLPTVIGPHKLIISTNGKWAASTNFVGGDSLSIFDIANKQVARTIKQPKYRGPYGIRFLQNDNLVAFTSGQSQRLVHAYIRDGRVISAAKTNQITTYMEAISRKKDFAYR